MWYDSNGVENQGSVEGFAAYASHAYVSVGRGSRARMATTDRQDFQSVPAIVQTTYIVYEGVVCSLNHCSVTRRAPKESLGFPDFRAGKGAG